MPQSLKSERLQWFKVDLDQWGCVAPPEKSRFPLPVRDNIYLDIGVSGRCVRNFFVQQIHPCDSQSGFTGPISGVAPTENYHLATKGWINLNVSGVTGQSLSGLIDVQTTSWVSGESPIYNGIRFIPINLYSTFQLSGVVGTGDVPSTRNLIAGAGLTGGGTLAADRTFNAGAGYGITVNADDIAVSSGTLDIRYALSGQAVAASGRGELHNKLLASGETCTVKANQQVLVAFEYTIDDDASLFLQGDGELVILSEAGIPVAYDTSLPTPASGTNRTLFRTARDITIQDTHWVLVGDNKSIGLSGTLRHDPDRWNYATPNEVFTGGFIAMPVSGSTAAFDDPTIPSGSWIWFQVNWNDPVGTVDEIALHIDYLEDV